METRAHHILIGLFTVLVVAGAMWFVLWMANRGPGDDVDRYDVVFREAVTGLSIGSRVLHSGIHVGTVERIHIDPDDPRQVIARIQVLATTPVKQDTRAERILANVTGASEIQLIGGTAQSPPLVSEEGGVPRIIADPSRFTRLTGSLTELLEDISTMIENGNRLLSEDNAAHLTRSLENLSEFSGALAGQSEEIFRGVQSLSRVSQEAEQLLHRVNGLVDNQGEALVTNGAQTMASLQSATASLDRLLRENEDGLTGGIQGLNALGPALEELRRTMATLRDVAQRFDNNPGGYLFSRETVREFQP
jgi:phospholipid/cholesterol/gamma-HCH transport system substrate-binding protein